MRTKTTLLLMTVLVPLAARSEESASSSPAHCEASGAQIQTLLAAHREKAQKLREKEQEHLRYSEALDLHEGKSNDVTAYRQRGVKAGQQLLSVAEAYLRLLERVRENGLKKTGSAASSGEFNAVLNQEIAEQTEMVKSVRHGLRESQDALESLKKIDVKQARERKAALEAELEPLRSEMARGETAVISAMEKSAQSGCSESALSARRNPDALLPLRAGRENTDKKKCDRLYELARPMEKKYDEAARTETGFEKEYADARLIERVAQDDRLLQAAEKNLSVSSARLQVEKEKLALLESVAANPKASPELAPLIAVSPGRGWIEFLQRNLNQNQSEFHRVKGATEAFKKKTADERRELMARLESKRTTVANTREAAERDYKKAMEPFEKAGCRVPFPARLMRLMAMSNLGPSRSPLFEGPRSLSDLGWPAQPIQAVPAPPPGTTR